MNFYLLLSENAYPKLKEIHVKISKQILIKYGVIVIPTSFTVNVVL